MFATFGAAGLNDIDRVKMKELGGSALLDIGEFLMIIEKNDESMKWWKIIHKNITKISQKPISANSWSLFLGEFLYIKEIQVRRHRMPLWTALIYNTILRKTFQV